MRIYGIDFTSAPRKAKPIVCCSAKLSDQTLTIDAIDCWFGFEQFETFLNSEGPWFAGLDLPLGQPSQLIQNLGWPAAWSDYVDRVGDMSRGEFVSLLEGYSHSQPAGQKHLFRGTDRIASSCSPMMLYGVPVAKMFFEAAPRLERTSVSVVPCRTTDDDRVVFETYPALIARKLVGRLSYKSSSRKNDTVARQEARAAMLYKLEKEAGETFGLQLSMSLAIQDDCVSNWNGDKLDSVFCCLQAAWASGQERFGVPTDVNSDEGWIVHPSY